MFRLRRKNESGKELDACAKRPKQSLNFELYHCLGAYLYILKCVTVQHVADNQTDSAGKYSKQILVR